MLGLTAFVVVGGRSAAAQEVVADELRAAAQAAEGEPAATDTPADAAPQATETTATPPAQAKEYTVQSGDTMYSVAKRHGVSVDALLWANKLTDANVLKQGQKLVIPPATGKLHTVKDGDTLDSLSTSYSVSKTGIAAVNGIAEDARLKDGQRLLIPVATKPPAADPTFAPTQLQASSTGDAVAIPTNAATGSPVPPLFSAVAPMITAPGVTTSTGSGTVTVTNRKIPKLKWPVPINPPKSGVSQKFRPGHTGIDVYTADGTSIVAAADGTIKLAEKNPDGFTGYGWIVIVDHGEGITTWYAHCGSFAVKTGDTVKAGQKLGTVGMTGRTTGPHLHFELRLNASAIDPLLALE